MKKNQIFAGTRAIFLCFVTAAMLPTIGYAKDYAAKNGAALRPEVIAALQKGEPQDLIVNLDETEINQHAAEKRKAKGLPYNDEQIRKETVLEIAALRETVFPQGRYDDAVVKESYENFATVILTVPTLQTLEKIIADPRVEGIYANQVWTLP